MTIRVRLSLVSLASAWAVVLHFAFVSQAAFAQQAGEPSQRATEILDARFRAASLFTSAVAMAG